MENKICSFFGHRKIDITDNLVKALTAEIMNFITLGCRCFYFGGYGEFDSLCYRIVTKIKEESESSGAYKAYKYAKRKKNKFVINLFPQ